MIDLIALIFGVCFLGYGLTDCADCSAYSRNTDDSGCRGRAGWRDPARSRRAGPRQSA
jgi:hypothetical protein